MAMYLVKQWEEDYTSSVMLLLLHNVSGSDDPLLHIHIIIIMNDERLCFL